MFVALGRALLDRLSHVIWALALVALGAMAAFVALHRAPVTPVAHSASTAPKRSIGAEIQALVDAQNMLAAAHGSTPSYLAPAVTIVHDLPALRGFTGAQLAQIFAALRPATVEKIGARLTTSPPSPLPSAPAGWTKQQLLALDQVDQSALQAVLNNPKTKIAVTVTRAPIPPTRIGSMLSPIGSGLGYAAIRDRRFELNLGILARGAHLSPALSPAWILPGTRVGIGPIVTYDRGVHVAIAATVHF